MFAVFMEHKLLSGIFLSLLLLSIICQIMIGVIYQRMIRETDNMSSTGNKLLKQMKMKFASCYQTNGGVANVSIFVDRFVGKISFLRISLTGLQHLSGQLMLLSVAAAGLGACREIIRGETVGRILPYYIVSFLGLYVWFAISGLVDIPGKKERLKINLVDYLENHMANRLKQSKIDWKALTGEEEPVRSAEETGRRKKSAKKERKDAESLREQIGLSAARPGGKVYEMADRHNEAGQEEGSGPEGGSDRLNLAVRKEPESAAPAAAEQAEGPAAGEKAQAVFSRQEEQELEELLREFFA